MYLESLIIIAWDLYYKFLVKYEKEYTIRLSKEEENVIEFVSKKWRVEKEFMNWKC